MTLKRADPFPAQNVPDLSRLVPADPRSRGTYLALKVVISSKKQASGNRERHRSNTAYRLPNLYTSQHIDK